MPYSTLHVDVSHAVDSNLSKFNSMRLEQYLDNFNNIGRDVYGWNYNISMSDAYTLINERTINGTGQTAMEIVKTMDLFLHGPGPDWYNENPVFKERVFNDIVAKRAQFFHGYLYTLGRLNEFLSDPNYYASFQAVYYAVMKGYLII